MSNIRGVLDCILFGAICFFLTRQVPFEAYSFISNAAVAMFVCYTLYKKEVSLMLLFLVFLLAYSIFSGNDFFSALRMGIIILALVSAHFIKLPHKIVCLLAYFSLFQCIFIISVSLMITFGLLDAVALLQYYKEMGWGTVRPLMVGNLYVVQIVGSGIITFVYMLSYVSDIFPRRCLFLFRIIHLIGIIVAGNFAYLVVVFCFHAYYYLKGIRERNGKVSLKKVFLVLLFVFILGGTIVSFVNSTLQRKSVSNTKVRKEQVDILFNDMETNPMTFFFGRGVGHVINKRATYRNYVNASYFEFQTLYFMNQLGVVFFSVFLFVLYKLAKSNIHDKNLLRIYLFYILYACTNPYMLDTTQFVVILTLVNINPHSYSIKYLKSWK